MDSPSVFELHGSIDGSNWFKLDRRDSVSAWDRETTKRFGVTAPLTVRHYRLLFNSVDVRASTPIVAVRELAFFGYTNVRQILARGGLASASSVFTDGSTQIGTPAQAFDGIVAKEEDYWHSTNGVPQWLQYEFSTPQSVMFYTITARKDSQYKATDSPKAFWLTGSNDGVRWSQWLDRRQNVAGWEAAPESTMLFKVSTVGSFKFYRLTVDDVQGRNGAKYVVIRELQFWGQQVTTPNEIVIRAEGGQRRASSFLASFGSVADAFDGDATTPLNYWHSGLFTEGVPQWIEYSFNVDLVTLTKYGIVGREEANLREADSPRDFRFLGAASSNPSQWSALSALAGVSGWSSQHVKDFSIAYPRPFKVFRLEVTKVAGRTTGERYVVIKELIFYGIAEGAGSGTTGPQELVPMAGGIATASSTSPLFGTVQQAFDGDLTSVENYWHSQTGLRLPQWLQYKFTQATLVTQYAIRARDPANLREQDSPRDFKLHGSTDGRQWTDLDTETSVTGWQAEPTKRFTVSMPGLYAWYRLEVTASISSWVVIRELQFYRPRAASVTSQTEVQLRTTGGQATAGTSDARFGSPGGAFDNDPNTEYHSRLGLPQFIQYSFPEARRVTAFSITARRDPAVLEADAPKDFKLKGSNDGRQWTDLAAAVGVTGWAVEPTNTKRWPVTNAQAFKMYRLDVTDVLGRPATAEKYLVIRELMFFESGSTTLPTTPTTTGLERQLVLVPTEGGVSTASSSWAGFGSPEQAFSAAGIWHAANGLPQWIQYEFPTGRTVMAYAITAREEANFQDSDSPKDFKLMVSDGRSDWQAWRVVDLRVGVVGWRQEAGGRKQFTCSAPTPGRTYRLQVDSVAGRQDGQAVVVIRQIQFYEFQAITTTFRPTFEARVPTTDGVPTASSSFGFFGSAGSAFDDEPSTETVWQSGNGMPQLLAYAFPLPQRVSAYAITVRSTLINRAEDSPKDFALEGSNDGTRWTTLDSQSNVLWTSATATMKWAVRAPQQFRVYRLRVASVGGRANGQKYAVIRTLAFFDDQAPSPPPPPAPPAPPGIAADCSMRGKFYKPLDMPGQPRTVENNQQRCQARCRSVFGCVHFSYWPDGGCHLSDRYGRLNEWDLARGNVPFTGPPACQQAPSPPPSPAPLGGQVSCSTRGKFYTPINMPGQVRTVERSAGECQNRCRRVSGCMHFSFWRDGGCHLADRNARLDNWDIAVAGPPTCR